MPRVGNKEFAYTPEGKKAARKAAMKAAKKKKKKAPKKKSKKKWSTNCWNLLTRRR